MIAAVSAVLMAFPNILSPERYEAILWGIWLIPLLALAAALRGLKAIFVSGLADDILRPLVMAALVVGIGILANGALSPRTIMQLALIAATATFLLGAVLLWRN